MAFKERLKEARAKCGMTQEQVASKIGIAKSTFAGYETGGSEPNMHIMSKIMDVLDVDANFLLQDQIRHNTALSPIELECLRKYRLLDEFGKETIQIAIERELSRSEKMREAEKKIEDLKREKVQNTIPRLFAYYGKIAAAGKSFGFEDILSGVTIEASETPLNIHADYTIGVSGDSMDPTYCDGDIVYVKKVERLKTGEIGIFQKDNCIYIKEAGENGLISHNLRYGFISGEGVTLLGKVIGKVEGDFRIIK